MVLESYLILSLLINLGFNTLFKTNKIIGFILSSLCALIPITFMSLELLESSLLIVAWISVTALNFREINSNEISSFKYLAVLIGVIVTLTSTSFSTILFVVGLLFLVRIHNERNSKLMVTVVSNSVLLDMIVFLFFSSILLSQHYLGQARAAATFLTLLAVVTSMILSLPSSRKNHFERFVAYLIQPLVFLKFIFVFKTSSNFELNAPVLFVVFGSVVFVLIKSTLVAPRISNLMRVFQLNNLIVFICAIIFGELEFNWLGWAIFGNFIVYALTWLNLTPASIKYKLSLLSSLIPIFILLTLGQTQIGTLVTEYGKQVIVLLIIISSLPLLLNINLVRGFDEKI